MSWNKTGFLSRISHIKTITTVLVITLFILGLRQSWVPDDAYIAFRVVDNFVNGFGLRWNIDERVQAYTSPLWVLLHIPFYFLYDNIYRLSMLISFVCMAYTIFILYKSIPISRWNKALFLLLPLTLSVTFRDYMFSAMENPLTFLLLALFIQEIFHPKGDGYTRIIVISALLLLTRLDNALLITPILLHRLYTHRKAIRIPRILLASSPIWGWMLFALCYYGFFFPNTKYAKLNSGIALEALMIRGIAYIRHFFFYDIVGFYIIFAALVVGGYKLCCYLRKTDTYEHTPVVILLFLGCVLNILYVVYAGGDFLAGRFLVNTFFISTIIFALSIKPFPLSYTISYLLIIGGLYAIGALHLSHHLPYTARHFPFSMRMGDHPNFYRPTTGLFNQRDHLIREEPTFRWVRRGKSFANSGRFMVVFNAIGMVGYYAGPHVVIIDRSALADPLLARIPVQTRRNWRPAHFNRTIPAGYLNARLRDDVYQMYPALAKYHEKLRIITKGDIFSLERFKTILEFQYGKYDHLIKEYMYAIAQKRRRQNHPVDTPAYHPSGKIYHSKPLPYFIPMR